ncbi:MAG: Ig-like domain-containing protein, partial [Thermoanaerobaculia bacterium]|nr:Ig-like domain-containing protein [Thermoanaerobaculia bacterium]
MIARRVSVVLLAFCLSLLTSVAAPAPQGERSGAVAAGAADDPVLWPEPHRAFLQDGPAWLLSDDERQRFRRLDAAARQAFIEEFLGTDPLPSTPLNELEEGIRRRRELAFEEYLSPRDVRAKLLFLNGSPRSIEPIECGVTFKPIEIWTYPIGSDAVRELVLYRPEPTRPFRLWIPIESKRVLYTREMEYYMEQFAALGGAGFRDQPDRFLCPDTRRVEEATGIRQLNRYLKNRPTNEDLKVFLEPPRDLADWAYEASRTELPERPEDLPVEAVSIYFPNRDGQRIVTSFYITLPPGVDLESIELDDGTKREVRLDVTALLEQGGEIFDEFKARFKLPPLEDRRLVLALDQPLRPNREFVVRLRIEDEIGGRRAFVSRGFRVPDEHQKLTPPPPPEEAIVAMAEDLASQRIAGADSLVLVPPLTDIVVAVWRAEALVTGRAIESVVFSVDGKKQLTRRRPPWTAEVKLAEQPTEQIVTAEGFDADGDLVARDEVILNQPKGALRVRILSPERGVAVSGAVDVRAEIVVPENRRVEEVEFRINDEVVATTSRPPWEATVEVPGADETAYLAVVATLDNGNRAEDVRFLNSPQYLEQVDVKLVELLTTVTGRDGRLVKGLSKEDFRVYED